MRSGSLGPPSLRGDAFRGGLRGTAHRGRRPRAGAAGHHDGKRATEIVWMQCSPVPGLSLPVAQMKQLLVELSTLESMRKAYDECAELRF